MKSSYLLIAIVVTALSSCETYNAMRQDPTTSIQSVEATEEIVEEEVSPLTPDLTTQKPIRVTPRQTVQTSSKPNRISRRDNGPFLVPNTFTIPTQADLKETATSTKKATNTPGLTVPGR